MTVNITATLTDPLNLIASFLMLLMGIFGTVCNLLIILIFVRSPSERNSFNMICVFRAIGNTFVIFYGFFATFIPMTLLGDSLFPPVYQYVAITTVNSIYTGLEYSGFIIAVNRFCAMYIPILYTNVFSNKLTLAILVLLSVYRVGKVFYEASYYIPLQCFSSYSAYDLTWSPDLSPDCRDKTPTSWLMVNTTALLLFVLIAINIATFVKIYLFYKSTEAEGAEVKRKMRKNSVLFLQTVLQDALYFIDTLFTFQLNGLVDSRYWTFLSGSLIWESVHSLDGLIMIMFNERLTFLKKSIFSSSANHSAVQQPKRTVTPRNYIAPVE